MILVAGATGMLGGEICRILAGGVDAVTALVRPSSNLERVKQLRTLGVGIVRGDLKERASLDAACRGVGVLVTTVSSTVSRQEGDGVDTVDRQGQLHLVEAAEAAGVGHFVLVSFPPVDIEFPLQSAKRAVEERLRRGTMGYTILQPTFFTEVWLSPALGFDVAKRRARIYGAGRNPISWISFQDVARFTVAALRQPAPAKRAIPLGGPDALSPLEVVALAEDVAGAKFAVEHVPEDALRAQYDAAADPLQRSFAALTLYYARGDVVDVAETLRLLPVEKLKSVRDYLEGVIVKRSTP
jgi:uncharacterized protein YbjT (DUF2867 family)